MSWLSRRQLCSATRVVVLLFAALGALGLPATAGGQPFGAFAIFNATTGKYLDIVGVADLNPTSSITIEAWVSMSPVASQPCRSIIGKNYTQTYWVGVCGNTLRSYLKGTPSLKDGGTVPTSQWTHIAVTYDGTNRIHYINGEQVAVFPETGALPTNSANVRIGSDVAFDFQPQGALDEIRFWSVARTVDQIRGSINVPITTVQPGLVSVWTLDGNGKDIIAGHNGGNVGGVAFLTSAVQLNCSFNASATVACLNTRFAVSIQFRDPNTGVTGQAQVVGCANSDSALFWFFASNAWEVMVKTVNACTFDSHYWAFSAATTNVFYRLEVTDVKAGVTKIYFNYPGPPAPAVTDTAAFATCP